MRTVREIRNAIAELVKSAENVNMYGGPEDESGRLCSGDVAWPDFKRELNALLDELVKAAQHEIKIPFRQED